MTQDLPVSAYRGSTIARISPPIVNSRASIATGICNSRSVAEVTGPIEANWMPLNESALTLGRSVWGRGGACPERSRRAPSERGGAQLPHNNSAKFLAVEELVKVTTCGRRAALFISARRRTRDFSGATVRSEEHTSE